MSRDIERRLRAALLAGAEVIGEDPRPRPVGDSDGGDVAVTRAQRSRPSAHPVSTGTARVAVARARELMGSQRWTLAAAAVILAILAALGVGLRNADRRHLAPVTPTNTTAPTTTATAPSPRPPSLHTGSCAVLPAPRC